MVRQKYRWSVTWLSLFLVTVELSLHLRLNYFAFRLRPLAKVEVVRNVAALVELWTYSGSSFSSSYFSFSSSSLPFPSTRPPTCLYSYIPSFICFLFALFLAFSPPRFLFFVVLLLCCVSASLQFPLGPRPIRVSG